MTVFSLTSAAKASSRTPVPMIENDREVQVYKALASMARDYIGGDATCSVRRRGRKIVITLKGIPSYDGDSDKITLEVPAGYVKFTQNGFKLMSMTSHECRYMCGAEAFSHPHVFSDGTPCWNGHSKEDICSLFVNLIDTYTWRNVTRDSKTRGRFTMNSVTERIIVNTDCKVEEYRRRIKPLVENWDVEPAKYFAKHYSEKFGKILR